MQEFFTQGMRLVGHRNGCTFAFGRPALVSGLTCEEVDWSALPPFVPAFQDQRLQELEPWHGRNRAGGERTWVEWTLGTLPSDLSQSFKPLAGCPHTVKPGKGFLFRVRGWRGQGEAQKPWCKVGIFHGTLPLCLSIQPRLSQWLGQALQVCLCSCSISLWVSLREQCVCARSYFVWLSSLRLSSPGWSRDVLLWLLRFVCACGSGRYNAGAHVVSQWHGAVSSGSEGSTLLCNHTRGQDSLICGVVPEKHDAIHSKTCLY